MDDHDLESNSSNVTVKDHELEIHSLEAARSKEIVY